MKIIALIYLFLMSISAIFFIVGIIIEKKFDENHSIKKWWRKHVIAPAPDDIEI